MHPHKVLGEYDVSLYIDGSIRVVGDVHELILNSFGSLASVYMYEHPARRCVYREAEIVSSISHDWIWNIAKQMRRYRREGFPTDYGLFEANVIIRRHDDAMERLMTKWWDEYLRGVRRDQLSLTYCAWKESVEIRSLGLSDARFTNRYFSFREHPRKRSIPIALRKHINKAVGHVVGYERLFGLGR
jgi:hypothetical protein